jgi:selenocysteine lyase/cysteine desulfurase
VPHGAGWFAGEDVWNSIYGTPLRLAKDARRLDTSPAWFSWVGAAPALEFLASIDAKKIFDHNITLANSLLTGLSLPTQNSAIITLDRPDAGERLKDAGIRTSVRAGKVRASFHLYNNEDDVALAVSVLK